MDLSNFEGLVSAVMRGEYLWFTTKKHYKLNVILVPTNRATI